MRRLLLASFAVVLAAPGFASDSLAHGGSYRDNPQGSQSGSGNPSPPTGGDGSGANVAGDGSQSGTGSQGGTGSEGGTGPQGGGGTAGTGSPPIPPPPPGPGGPGAGGGGSTRGQAQKGPGLASWTVWWDFNKDEILQLKSALKRAQGPTTGSVMARRVPVRSVTDSAIAERIVPALRTLLADDSQSRHVRSAAELGLAKIGDGAAADTLRVMLLNDKKSLHAEIEESAALALGLMQRDDAATRQILLDVLQDPSRDGTFARPFSAVSLALLGGGPDERHAAIAAFVSIVSRKEPDADVKPACIAGLGLLGDEAAASELLCMVRRGKASAPGAVSLDGIETAYAVSALGKIGRPGAGGDETGTLNEILQIVEHDRAKAGPEARRSAVIALGQIGARSPAKLQRRAVATLKAVVEKGGDEQERNFAVMSMGRIGSAKGVDAALRRDIVASLASLMDKARGQTPAFAALALGLVGRAVLDEGGAAPEDDVRAPLRAKFAKGGEAQTRGAFALASGLVRDPLAAAELAKTLADRTENKTLRGWAALALGMIGARNSIDAIRVVIRNETDSGLRVRAALAAGLIGDPGAVLDLIAVVRDQDTSNYEFGSAALALGQIGDERAIDALLEVALDKTKGLPDLNRGLAVVALGQIGDRRDVPTLARLASDVNYRARVPAILEMLSIY